MSVVPRSLLATLVAGALILLGTAPAHAEMSEPLAPSEPVLSELLDTDANDDAASQTADDDSAAVAECPGAVPGTVVDGVITVTCGADDGPGTLREAAALSASNAVPVRIEISPDLPVIVLDDTVEFEGWLDLSGNGVEATTIRPSEDFPQHGFLLTFNGDARNNSTTRLADLHISGDSRAGMGFFIYSEEREIILEGLRVSGSTVSGIEVVSSMSESLTVENSLFDGNGFFTHGVGMAIYGSAPDLSVLVEDVDFKDNSSGLASGIWLGPDSDATFEVRGSRFINNGETTGENWVGGLVIPIVTGATAQGAPRVIVADSLFQGNSGKTVGGIQGSAPYMENEPGTPGTAVLITGTTFTGNTVHASNMGQGATDVHYDQPILEPNLIADPVLRIENSTLDNAAPAPNIVAGWGITGLQLEHVTLRGGGIYVVPLADPLSVAVSNSVLDTGAKAPIVFERAGDEQSLVTVTNRGAAFTTLGNIELGENSLVASSAELALGPLETTLGLTPTMLPGPKSVLIDAAVADPAAPQTDQRGVPRPAAGGKPDIGAVEVRLGMVKLLGDVTVDEGDPAEFVAELVEAGDHPVTVSAVTQDGTAKVGTDYTATNAQLAWALGETGKKSITVQTVADDEVRADRAFTLALTEPSGATVGTPGTAVGTIHDTSEEPEGGITPPTTPPTKPPTKPGTGVPKPPGGSLGVTGSGEMTLTLTLLLAGAVGAGTLLVRSGLRRRR